VQLGESVAHNHLFKLLKIHYLWDMCHWDFFYKIKGEKGRGDIFFCNVIQPKIFLTKFYYMLIYRCIYVST
jgi:hypothetical protein